jgi:uncharacterized protein
MIMRLFLTLVLALFLSTPGAAQNFPKLTGRVVDRANLLDPGREAALSAKLEALERQTGRQLVVATIPSLQGRTIEDFGYRLGRAWGIGSAEKDDGVLLIVAPNERRVRIETGYGARVFLTDAMSSVIIRNAILPRFRANDFAGGIEAGVDQLATQMQLSPQEAQRRLQEAEAAQVTVGRDRGGSVGFLPLLFFGLVMLFVLSSFGRRAGGRRYRGKRRRASGGVDPLVVLWGLDLLGHAARGGGGGFGGGFGGGGFGGGGGGFSGGGGSFGGGGASGSW